MQPAKVWPYRLTAAFLIVGATVLRLIYLACDCPLDLAPDEAHYWDWSRHLDWSYYSKGPLVAWLIWLSCALFGDVSIALTGTETLAVRLPAVACGALLLTSLYVLTAQVLRREAMALGIVALGVTFPMLAVGSSLMTIDAPFTCCWGWALVLTHRAVFGEDPWAWFGAGLLVGLGLLAKYTMVLFLPSLALFLVTSSALRPLLWRRGFWILSLSAALCTMPIVVWNAQHGLVTLRHTGGHAGLQHPLMIDLFGPLNYLGMQFAVLLGYWFVVWAVAMVVHRPTSESDPHKLYLWWMSAPMFLFFGAFSLKNGGGEPNWPAAAYISGLVLAADCLVGQCRSPRVWWSRLTIAAAASFAGIGMLLTLAVHFTTHLQPVLTWLSGPPSESRAMPLRRFDPTCRLRGWRALAAEVDRVRDELRRQGIEPVIAGCGWSLPGELGFYCDGRPTVYSLGLALGDRHSQYDLWRPNPVADPEGFAGRTFIVVDGGIDLAPGFERLEPRRLVIYQERGQPIARWYIVVAHGYRGFGEGPQEKATY